MFVKSKEYTGNSEGLRANLYKGALTIEEWKTKQQLVLRRSLLLAPASRRDAHEYSPVN